MWLVFNDPPTHTRLRKLAQRAFTRKAMAAMRAGIERLVNELIDAMLDRAETDFVRDFAYPLPANVVADVLGVPREHVEDLKRWSDDLAQFVLTSRVNPDKYAVAAASLRAMNELFAALIEERRKHPGDGLMDVLIAARDGRDALSEEELVAFCVLLLFAGHETTTHFFSNGLRGLVLHPEQMADLRANHRDRALLSNAIDELLRWDGPVLSASRVVAEDVSRAGRKLLAGQRVYVFNGAANRDPEMFSRPDDLDIRRPRADKMVTFGYGIHLCLGIHLARLEGLVGFPILLDRLRDIELLRPDLEWTDTLVMRGPVSMPIRFRG